MFIHGHELEVVSVAKCLGVTFQADLGWGTHVMDITTKGSKRLYLLCRLRQFNLPVEDLVTVYTCFIRPVLEYAAPLWHPGLTNAQHKKIERIQRRATRIILGHNLSYNQACKTLKLQSLYERREDLCIEFGKKLLKSTIGNKNEMAEIGDVDVWEVKISGDRVVFRPIEKTRSLRRRETAPGRQESCRRPPDDAHPNAGKRRTITTHAVVHNVTSSLRKERFNLNISVSGPVAVRPKEPPPQPADAPCRPPDPLYVRRVGQRFWSTKRILDWQRQALRAKEDPEAVLKPVRDYGEDSVFKCAGNGEAGLQNHGRTHYENDREPAHYGNDREHAHNKNDSKPAHYENDGEHAHYENDGEHARNKNDREHAHKKNVREHALYENDREHAHYKNDREHAHYENDREHARIKNDREHAHYENDREHAHYENDREDAHYENDREHAHYENDREHARIKNDREHAHYENDREDAHYENDREHAHDENDRGHKYYQYDKNHAHYEKNRDHKYYLYDKNHVHYENDEEQSNLSTHVYADLDPEFLAAQDAIRNATAQPFYEMDISPVDDEQEQPLYRMDVTAAKDKEQQEQPFYEMDVTSADEEKEQQPFYQMDENRQGQPASSSNVYAGLDPEFVAAQDEACRRRRAREPGRGADDGDPRCSQNCRVFFGSRPVCMVAVCVGIIIAVIATVVVAFIFNQGSEQNIHSDDGMNQTTLPTTLTIPSAQMPVTSQATSRATEGKDWQLQWTLYIREYFGENGDVARALEERYAASEVVMSLLQDRFFWYWTCRYWFVYGDLPCTLSNAVAFCVNSGTAPEYMASHGFSAYSEFFTSALNALEALPNVTTSTDSELTCISVRLFLSGRTLSDNDVTALVYLFPYLKDTDGLNMVGCSISAKAATSIAERLHLLSKLTYLSLRNNKIGDDGVRAIAGQFPYLTKLRYIDINRNSITRVGGKAMANRLAHLQELQDLHLSDNALALSLSSLAKAFVNMPRLEFVDLLGVTCRAASYRMAAQQARDAVHTIAGQVREDNIFLYDGSRIRKGATQELAWQRVKRELQTGVRILSGKLTVRLRIRLLQ
ncbi:NLRC5 [Branchiostoma lanceolatum]|uniref:NLRC5 protein n=1 Tax=Branchiostoma lanceolatum TaxID=7740 RepID=A0A8J9ZNI1_BRALA|nr:NLRC5 [Branchiostoma lanceolatum]